MVDVVPIDLALQGGGAHAAFTWGVLDRLLDERGLHYVAISGASAGAMNAVVFARVALGRSDRCTEGTLGLLESHQPRGTRRTTCQ